MKNLTLLLSSKLKNCLSLGNEPALDRKWIGSSPARLLSILTLFLMLFSFGVGSAWGTDITYTFTSKSWTATSGGSAANWTSGKDGAGFSNNGIQVTNNASYTGANGTSPISFTNVTQVVCTYNTNKSKGAGTIGVQVGSNSEETVNWAYSGSADGTSANFTATVNYATPQTGNVKITLNTTTNSIYLVSVKITYGGGSTPSVTPDPTSLDWGSVLQSSSQSTKTFSISGSNLTGNLSVAVTGGYSVSCGSSITVTSGTPNVTTITVTPPSTSTTGTKNGTVTISGGGLASNVVVNLSMTVNAASTVTWMNNGSEYTTTLVANGSKPEFPDNPSSCDGTSTTFVGWTQTPWSGKIDDISGKTTDATKIYTAASQMPTVAADVTYHAVFAKVRYNECTSLSSDDVILIVNPANAKALQTDGTWAGRSVTISGSGTSTYIEISATDIQWIVEKSSSNYKFKTGTYYLCGTTTSPYVALSASSYNWTLSGSDPYQLTYNSSRYFEYYNSAFTTYNKSGTGDAYDMKFYLRNVSNYITSCCTPLGSINGSFLWT